MGFSPCGDHCCGHSFQLASKVCAAVDLVFGVIGFASTLSILLRWDTVFANLVKDTVQSQINQNRWTPEDAQNIKNLYYIFRGLVITILVAQILQTLLGIVLYIAAVRKSKTLCLVYIVLTIPQLLLSLIRLIEVLIVASFLNEIKQEESTDVQDPITGKNKSNQSQVSPHYPQQYQNNPGTMSSHTSPLPPNMQYPPPPQYDYQYQYSNNNGTSLFSANKQS